MVVGDDEWCVAGVQCRSFVGEGVECVEVVVAAAAAGRTWGL